MRVVSMVYTTSLDGQMRLVSLGFATSRIFETYLLRLLAEQKSVFKVICH